MRNTYKILDAYLAEKNTLGKYAYANWYPFKTKSGRWFAFHNQSYTDIKIVDLETKEVVIENVYKKDKYYAHHCNVETYVPSYIVDKQSETYENLVEDYLIDAWFKDESLTKDSLNNLEFLPLAFNAWTIWAADYELYCDILDLSEVENGILRIYDKKSLILPICCSTIRDHIILEAQHWYPLRNQNETDEEYNKRVGALENTRGFDFSYYVEERTDRFIDGRLSNINKKKGGDYKFQDKMPWERVRDFLEKKETYEVDFKE